MASNHGVVYLEPGKVEVQSIDYPELKTPQGRNIDHGVIIKPITTNICGSDQHMVRGRTTAPPGLVLGHEITGEVIECGSGVEFISKGDLVSVPFNVACGRCRNCKERHTDVCLNVNPSRAGGAYGYVDLGGWVGGQAEYVMVPYADWNLLRFPDRDQALAKIRDLTCLSDILPTGYHGCVSAGVTTGSTVLISGAGPLGLRLHPRHSCSGRQWCSSRTSIGHGSSTRIRSAAKQSTSRKAVQSPNGWSKSCGFRKWIVPWTA